MNNEYEDCVSKDDDNVEHFFARFDELLTTDSVAALAWVDAAPSEIRELDDWVLCRCDALVEAESSTSAVCYLSTVLDECPGFADAHYRLATLYEQLGNRDAAVAQHLETLRLDLEKDELESELDEATFTAIADEAARTIAQLPERFRRRIGNVPIFLEARPSVALIRDGFDSRALGLFFGPSQIEVQPYEPSSEPTGITLFTHCLWDTFGLDEAELLEEVRVTVLHEVGHFLGLDEEDVAALGLE
jgi:predicted Zn-dependent protease with MMP-like domain